MKTIKLLLLSFLITAYAYGQQNPIEGKIEAAFGQSFATQQNQVENIINDLKKNESENAYWIAYAKMFSSIFYQQAGQTDKAEQEAKEAINLLDEIKDKNSEEHALLGYLLGYSISFQPSAAGVLVGKAAGQYKSALKKDENNIRAYLGLGESDYHRPASFGGGKKVEEYLLKVISLPEQSTEGGPSWGKNTAYFTLASFYLREGKTDKAKMYCMQGLNKFPSDMRLNQLKQSF